MPSYDDNDFLDQLKPEDWQPAYTIANRVGCTWSTANRRLIQLAKAGEVAVLDPENDERGIPENETTARPLIQHDSRSLSPKEGFNRAACSESRTETTRG